MFSHAPFSSEQLKRPLALCANVMPSCAMAQSPAAPALSRKDWTAEGLAPQLCQSMRSLNTSAVSVASPLSSCAWLLGSTEPSVTPEVPPGMPVFSSQTTFAPSSAARTAAKVPAVPEPATTMSASSVALTWSSHEACSSADSVASVAKAVPAMPSAPAAAPVAARRVTNDLLLMVLMRCSFRVGHCVGQGRSLPALPVSTMADRRARLVANEG